MWHSIQHSAWSGQCPYLLSPPPHNPACPLCASPSSTHYKFPHTRYMPHTCTYHMHTTFSHIPHMHSTSITNMHCTGHTLHTHDTLSPTACTRMYDTQYISHTPHALTHNTHIHRAHTHHTLLHTDTLTHTRPHIISIPLPLLPAAPLPHCLPATRPPHLPQPFSAPSQPTR